MTKTISERLEEARSLSCGCTDLFVFDDAISALAEVNLSEAELEQACKDLDLENEGLRAICDELLTALKAAERFIFNKSGGGETTFREEFLLPAIAKAEALPTPSQETGA